jgi:DNA-binding PadR family transcriptional regulator
MTDAELAILSLLSEGPSYDHDLNTVIEDRGLRKWTAIGHSSMYYILDKLEHQGLIEKISEEQGHRKFRISAAGIGVLQTAVADLLSTPHAYDKSFELGLANLHVLKPSQIRTALLSRRQDMAIKLGRLREEREDANGIFQIDALFDHHIYMLEAEITWLDEFTAAWEAQAPAEPEVVIEPSIAPRIKQVVLPHDPDSVHKRTTRQAPPYKQTTPPSLKTKPPVDKKPPEPEEPEDDTSDEEQP